VKALKHISVSSPSALIITGVLFSIINAFALYKDFLLFSALPAVILAAYLAIYHPKLVLLIIVFATPLSVNLENIKQLGGIGAYLPTEPLLFGMMVMYLLHMLFGHRERGELMRHPLTIAIIFSLVWLTVTTITSSMPVVSFKFVLARLWFIIVMYFMINRFFSDEKYIRNFMWLYMIGMSVVITYTVLTHASYGFAEGPAHWVMYPFFKDHTSYGAIIALFFPMVVFHFFHARFGSLQQAAMAIMLAIFSVGLVLSYTRAAWVSLVGALGVFLLMKFRVDFKLVALVSIILFGLFFAFQDQIMHNLSKNRQDSSGDFREHVQSITNVSSDASNLERLNRWNSALRMFSDRPFFGFGPGTYMFQYAIYQKSSDKTIISTNQADGGNAHSEYLGPLAESGVIGALAILAIFITSLYTGINLYYKLDSLPYLKGVVMAIVLGLVTYYIHGILNNYLDTDKASVPLWGMMSILVAIQIYQKNGSFQRNLTQSKAVSSK
jgi:O-antigen ligase